MFFSYAGQIPPFVLLKKINKVESVGSVVNFCFYSKFPAGIVVISVAIPAEPYQINYKWVKIDRFVNL